MASRLLVGKGSHPTNVVIVRETKQDSDSYSCCYTSEEDGEGVDSDCRDFVQVLTPRKRSNMSRYRDTSSPRPFERDDVGSIRRTQRWKKDSGEPTRTVIEIENGTAHANERTSKVDGADLTGWDRPGRSRASILQGIAQDDSRSREITITHDTKTNDLDISASLFGVTGDSSSLPPDKKASGINSDNSASTNDQRLEDRDAAESGRKGDATRKGHFIVGGWRRNQTRSPNTLAPDSQESLGTQVKDMWKNEETPKLQGREVTIIHSSSGSGSTNIFSKEPAASQTNSTPTSQGRHLSPKSVVKENYHTSSYHDQSGTLSSRDWTEASNRTQSTKEEILTRGRGHLMLKSPTPHLNGSTSFGDSSTTDSAMQTKAEDISVPPLSLPEKDNLSFDMGASTSMSLFSSSTADDHGSGQSRRALVLTRYSSPQDVLRRISTKHGSSDRPDSRTDKKEDLSGGRTKVDPEESADISKTTVDHTDDIHRLKEEIITKNHIIDGLHEEIQRIQTNNDHLQEQLCESDSFIEKKVSELAKRTDDSHQHWHRTQEENKRLRAEAEAHSLTISQLRDQMRELESAKGHLQMEKAELTDKLRVANEVVAAHQNQASRPPSTGAAQAPLRHENDLLRQQLERQDREITLLRREVGPARLLSESRSRPLVPTASDRLNMLLENMEGTTGAQPARTTQNPNDLSVRHDDIMRRANAALTKMQSADADCPVEEEISRSPPPPALQTTAADSLDQRLQHHRARAMEPPPTRMERQQQSADPLSLHAGVRPAIPAPSRSPGMARLLEKYRGGPARMSASLDTDEETPEDSPRPSPAVTVYSMGRMIHDAESRRPTREQRRRLQDRGRSAIRTSADRVRLRARSEDNMEARVTSFLGQRPAAEVDYHSTDENMGLWSSPVKPEPRENCEPRATVDPVTGGSAQRRSSPIDRLDPAAAKLYANRLIDRYVAQRKR